MKEKKAASNTTSGAGAGGAAGTSASFFFLEVSNLIKMKIENAMMRKSMMDSTRRFCRMHPR
jgi:hypothetical protein